MIRCITRVWGKRTREESFGLHFNEVDEGTAEIRTLSAGAVDDQPDAGGLSAPLPHDSDVLLDSLAARQDIFRYDKLSPRELAKAQRKIRPPACLSATYAARLTSGRLPDRN